MAYKKWMAIVVGSLVVATFTLNLSAVSAQGSVGSCTVATPDGCWSRFYAAGGSPGNESKIYFRIDQACVDGMRISVAANIVNSDNIYIKQYGSDQSPPFRVLTEWVTIPLDPYPAGVLIESGAESATPPPALEMAYYAKTIIVSWGRVFNPAYDDELVIGYQTYSENDATGAVRAHDLQNCHLFGNPRATLTPFVDCATVGRGSISATFGYTNNLGYDAILPKPIYNSVSAFYNLVPIQANQPTYLSMGVHHNAISVTAAASGLAWYLAGNAAVANSNSPAC